MHSYLRRPHARQAHLEAERRRRQRLRSVRPRLSGDVREPNHHALRLIKQSAGQHRGSRVDHRASWNSRTTTASTKIVERKPIDRSMTLRRGGGKTASTANVKLSRQNILRKKKKKYSFEDSLRGGSSHLMQMASGRENSRRAGNRTTKGDHAGNQRKLGGSESISGNINSSYIHAGPAERKGRNPKSKSRSKKATWTRGGMRLHKPGAKFMRPGKIKSGEGPLENSQIKGVERQRARSAPASDNKGVPPKNWRQRPPSQGSNISRGNRGSQLNFEARAPTASNTDLEERFRGLQDSKSMESPEEDLDFTLGTIDPNLLSEKRTSEDDDFDETPGGIWGDGIGEDLSTILECSESQSFANFLSPATQRLMASHLKFRSKAKDDRVVSDDSDVSYHEANAVGSSCPSGPDTSGVVHEAGRQTSKNDYVDCLAEEEATPKSHQLLSKWRIAVTVVRAVLAFKRNLCTPPPPHRLTVGNIEKPSTCNCVVPSFVPSKVEENDCGDSSLVLYDGIVTCNTDTDDSSGEEYTFCENESSEYHSTTKCNVANSESEEDYYESEFEDTKGESEIAEASSVAVSDRPQQHSPASIVYEDSVLSCSLDLSSALAESVADESFQALQSEAGDSSYRFDEDEFEKDDESDSVVQRLADLLSGTGLREEIRQELRRESQEC